MKKQLLLFIFFIILTSSKLYSQLDKNGNPIFNSEKIEKNIIKEKITGNHTNENSNIEGYIKTESRGGKLDFKNTVEKNNGAFINFEGVIYNQKDFTILMWGAAVKKMGIKDLNKAQQLWQEINERNLTEPELKALQKGFETKL